MAQNIIYYYFKNLGVTPFSCSTLRTITDSIVGHNFCVISLLVEGEYKLYLLDPTYVQFFKKQKCNKDNYFILNKESNIILITPDPGYFVEKENIKVILSLLNNGYIELTEKVARIYGDSFYNTKVGIEYSDELKTIPGHVYISSFLKGNEKLSKSEEEINKLNLIIK